MVESISVVAGPAGCGKTERLLADFARVVATFEPGSALWLCPTHRAAALIRGRLAALVRRGCLSPNVLTFGQLSHRVLDLAPVVVRPLAALEARILLRRIVDRAVAVEALSHFTAIAHTGGFLDLLVRYLEELKRLEIWPDELVAACGRHPTAKDRDLSYLYGEYQRQLAAHDLYDAQGRLWAARAQLRDAGRHPFERVRHVFVDGFTDLTRTEHEIVDILAQAAQSVTISLTLEAEPHRRALFAKSRRTLEEFERRHRAVQVEHLPRRATSWSARDHVEQHLFANPRTLPECTSTAGFEILAASGVRAEIELVARRIKSLLVQGDGANGARVRPGDVLVVFRSLREVAPLVRHVFGEFGIPASVEGAEPLARASGLAALVGWLRLDLEDWPFASLVSLLGHNTLRPQWREWRGGRAVLAAEWLARRLQIPAGHQALLSQAKRLADGLGSLGEETDKQLVARQAKLAYPLLDRLSAALDRLPERATPTAWANALTTLAEALGLVGPPKPASDAPRSEPPEALDRAAWQQLLAALVAAARLDEWLGQAPGEWSRREVLVFLEEVLRLEPLDAPGDETGCVRVLGAEAARNLSAPYVFLAGLSEQSFPATEREDCLAGEAEVRRLAAAGLPLVAQAERRGYEMLLFYEVVTRATRSLTLSYPALDPRAQPLSPSPYVAELQRACGSTPIKRHEALDLGGVPAGDEVFSPRDFRTRAVAEAVGGDFARWVTLPYQAATAHAAPNIVAALRASQDRARGPAYGPYEGILLSPAAGRVLAERFGPEHAWSASRLEQYAGCPFQFYVQHVLRLEPVEDPVLATDYLNRGRMLHWLLAALHRSLNERGGARVSPAATASDQLADDVTALIAELVTRLRRDHPLADGLMEIDARRLATWLMRYHAQHLKYDEAWAGWDTPPRPAHFEVSFGRADSDPDAADPTDPLSRGEPFVLDCGGQAVRFTGRIDRIDVGSVGGQTVFNIIDYKSGRSSRGKIASTFEGYAFQLPLYALAAQRLLGSASALPLRAAYWHVSDRGCQDAIEFHIVDEGHLHASDEWQALAANLRRRMGSLVAGVRQGQFPMHSADQECTSRCAYHTVCRVNQARALEKTWQPPAQELS